MKVMLEGKEFKCHCFSEAKPGDVIVINQCVYVKTAQNTIFGLCSGVTENYGGQPITIYPCAVMYLEPHCHHKKDECLVAYGVDNCCHKD